MSAQSYFADWIAVDWGNSCQRAWAIGADGQICAEVQRASTSRDILPGAWEAALRGLIGDWLGIGQTPVLACGMIGGRGAIFEVPYRSVPANPADLRPVPVTGLSDQRLALSIMPGLCQCSPADVMRGEETQLLGFFSQQPDFDGVVCLPGTHTKWVQISAAEVVSFQTAMTGEMFALLAAQSCLSSWVTTDEIDLAAFDDSVADLLADPRRLSQRLFAIRADALLNGVAAPVGRGRLSGALIGAELAATRPYWLGQAVAVIGGHALSALYLRALAGQGMTAQYFAGDTLTLAGLAQIRATLVGKAI